MVEITLLEVHLDDATVDANATADATTDAVTALPFGSVVLGDEDEESSEQGGTPLKPIVLLVGIVVIVLVAWKLLSEDNE